MSKWSGQFVSGERAGVSDTKDKKKGSGNSLVSEAVPTTSETQSFSPRQADKVSPGDLPPTSRT
jgi:hypothetical protein